MKFDSIITLLFIIGFFVLPSILKQVKARKKKTAAPGATLKKPTVFSKIGDQIQQFVQELEKQGQQQKNKGKGQGNIWETLAEGEDLNSGFERSGNDADFGKPMAGVSQKKVAPEKVAPSAARVRPQRKEPSVSKPMGRPGARPYCFKSRRHPLQNAIIWSEILSKPIALRDEQKNLYPSIFS